MEISSHNFFGFTDYNSRNTHGIFNPHVFYPGNTVVGRLPSLDDVKLLTPNIPIHKNKKGKPFKAKVSRTTENILCFRTKVLKIYIIIEFHSILLNQLRPIRFGFTGNVRLSLKKMLLTPAC